MTQCSYSILSYKCVLSGKICRSDRRAPERPPQSNCPQCLHECLRLHSFAMIVPLFLKSIVSFSIKAPMSLEKVNSLSSQQQPGVVYCVISILGPRGDIGEGTRKAWSGVGPSHYNQQPIFNKHPCGNNDNNLGDLELYFQNGKEFVNKMKSPAIPIYLVISPTNSGSAGKQVDDHRQVVHPYRDPGHSSSVKQNNNIAYCIRRLQDTNEINYLEHRAQCLAQC